MNATDELVNILHAAGLDISPAQARALIGAVTHDVDLTLRVLIEKQGTDPVVHALADVVEPGNLVAAMVDEGVLAEVAGAGWRPEFGDVGLWPLHRPDDSEPLYRAAEPGEGNRG